MCHFINVLLLVVLRILVRHELCLVFTHLIKNDLKITN